ncbi:KUP/HAK/KT family potassium transporter [Klebsiella pneumoniae]|nr:KUP/HAK/KT family potassium transporter [Klebsiella pneumoniae]
MLICFLLLAVLAREAFTLSGKVLQAPEPLLGCGTSSLQYKTVSLLRSGAVVLSITGVEALYADMGHFGKLPESALLVLRRAASLVLNYFYNLFMARAPAAEHPTAIKTRSSCGADGR